MLIAHELRVDRAWLAAHAEDEVGGAESTAVQSLFLRRRAGEPIAYLTGEREFYGLALAVTPAVLIPRPETELLVDIALKRLKDGARALDLGTGSGAVAIALALARPAVSVTACEASDDALEVARANARRHGARVRFAKSDWFSALGGERFDLIVSNPPYIASGDPHLTLGDVRFEPRQALEAGPTGLECIEAIAVAARLHLAACGWLVLEHGYDQGESCVQLLVRLGYAEVADRRDLAGAPRAVLGRFDPPSADH